MSHKEIEITQEDIDIIEEMAMFYEITREEALERYITENYDGITFDEEDI